MPDYDTRYQEALAAEHDSGCPIGCEPSDDCWGCDYSEQICVVKKKYDTQLAWDIDECVEFPKSEGW